MRRLSHRREEGVGVTHDLFFEELGKLKYLYGNY
jgi:hypothetical protein